MKALALLGLAAALAAPAAAAPKLAHRLYVAPDEARALDSRALAELLTARLRKECGSSVSGRAIGDDSELVMMVPAAVIPAIRADGFRNQHETGTTLGFDLGEERFEAEQELAMMRLPYDRRGRELLPKYALLNARRPELGRFPMPMRYGSVAIVFKKDVQRRATWTFADTLDHQAAAGRWLKGGRSNPVLARSLQETPGNGDPLRCENYCEAQIWGPLSWGDVEYAMMRGTEPIPAALLDSGVPVFRMNAPEDAATPIAPGQTEQFARAPIPVDERGAPLPVAAPPGVELVRRAKADADRSDDELLKLFRDDAAATGASPRAAERLRVVSELAVRPKTPAIAEALRAALRSPGATEREVALWGLSELSWDAFKPSLLAGLEDRDWTVQIEAVALAAEHRKEREVASRLSALAARVMRPDDVMHPHAQDVSEWLARLDAKRFCK